MSKICKFKFKAEDNSELILEIKNQTTEQITNLFNNYNKEYERGSFDGTFIDYLKGEGIEFILYTFDLELEA